MSDYNVACDILSNKGSSEFSEDRFLARGPESKMPRERGLLYAIADGMSGHRFGRIASGTSIFYADQGYFRSLNDGRLSWPDHLVRAMERANWEVHTEAVSDSNDTRMGSTLSCLLLLEDSAHICHVGDSRIYRITPQDITQLTIDHHDERGLLTEFIGKGDGLNIHAKNIQLEDDDIFLLCSDGLKLDQEYILKTVIEAPNLRTANQTLIHEARKRGSTDDITSMLLEVLFE